MGKFFLKLSRTGLLMMLFGAVFVAFAFQDTITSLKAPKSFDDVMEEGAAAEIGTYDELVRLGGRFSELERLSRIREQEAAATLA